MTKVLEALWHSKGASRAEIARRIRVDRSTVGAIAEFLLKRGIVSEKSGPSTGGTGRPPVALQLNNAFAYTLGIAVAHDHIHIVATGYCSQRLHEEVVHEVVDVYRLSEIVVALVEKTVHAMERVTSFGLQAVVIAVSGIVNRERGSILASSDLGVRRAFDIGEEIERAIAVPVWIYNDADVCALGEQYYGDGTLNDFLFVLVKSNIYGQRPSIRAGLGIVLNGTLRESHTGSGREFRSPLLTPDSTSQFLTAEHLRQRLISPEQAWVDFTDELGLSLAFLIHALDIEHVVLGGDAAEGDFEMFAERVTHHVYHNTGIFERTPIVLRRPTAGANPVAYGASAAAAGTLFQTHRFVVENIGV